MLIAVRAEVEDVETWRQEFKTHGELFKRQGVSIAYMGSTDGKSVLSVFDTNDVDEFMRIFNDPATAEAMANDKITGGVELFVLDESFSPQESRVSCPEVARSKLIRYSDLNVIKTSPLEIELQYCNVFFRHRSGDYFDQL